ncbi:MAG: 16S rRNA (guanine(966)-N(2))-methyltransferase RsmD [Firmicutes bacterium]|nr:16S rRNA (guanine(966)-N(2))-methyltransferase RsmD [Bacillota bacterium]
MMRIVGGINRHRMIKWPVNPNSRPSKDIVRQGVFNAIGDAVIDKKVLDLFAGSGSLGIEAMSRGAKMVAFVDRDEDALDCIRDNIDALKIPNAEVIESDAFTSLYKFANEHRSFDIIILDPPYLDHVCEKIISLVIEKSLWAKDGIIVCETNSPLNINPELYRQVRTYHYGITTVTIIWR